MFSDDRISLQIVCSVLIDLNEIVSPMQAISCAVQVAVPVSVSVSTRQLVLVLVSAAAETRMPLLVMVSVTTNINKTRFGRSHESPM